jgi:hypothetical protein
MDKDFVITVRLTALQVNLILSKLGQCPFVEVAELINELKQQGDAAVEAARQSATNGASPVLP